MKKYSLTLLLFWVFFFICPVALAETKVKVGEDMNGKKVVLYGEISKVTVPSEISRMPTTIVKALSNPGEIIYHNEKCQNERVYLIKYRWVCYWQEYKYQTENNEIIKVGDEISVGKPTFSLIFILTLSVAVGLFTYFLFLLFLLKTKRYESLADSSKTLVIVNILLTLLTFASSTTDYPNIFLTSGFIIMIASTIFATKNHEKKTGSKGALIVFLALATLALIFLLIGFYNLELKVQ